MRGLLILFEGNSRLEVKQQSIECMRVANASSLKVDVMIPLTTWDHSRLYLIEVRAYLTKLLRMLWDVMRYE